MQGKPNQFLDEWNAARLATGRFDSQLGGGLLEQQKQNRDTAPIFTVPGTYGKYAYLRGAVPIRLKTDTPEDTYNRYQEGLKNYTINTARRINADENQQGEYNEQGHTIFYKTDGINPESTLLHEQSHASKAKPQESIIKDIILKNKEYNNTYKDDESEIYSRLMQVREANQIDPNKVWDEESLKEFKKTATDFNFLHRYNDDTVIDIFNNVADAGNIQNEENKTFVAAEGGIVPKYDEGTDGVDDDLNTSGIKTVFTTDGADWRKRPTQEQLDAFYSGNVKRQVQLAEQAGKTVTYANPKYTLDEVVVTAKDLKKEQQRKKEYNNVLDLGITAAGFVPGLGEVADVVDVVNQLRQGNYGDAGLSALAAIIPGVPASIIRRGGNDITRRYLK